MPTNEVKIPNMSHPTLAKYGNKIIVFIFVFIGIFWLVFATVEKSNQQSERLRVQNYSLSLANLSQKIDARIANMQLIAKSLANDTHIHRWVNAGFAAEQEAVLVNKLQYYVNEYALTSASFADKNTHKYWNHEGFLRVLQPDVDTWYFAYLAGTDADLISVYHDKNKHRVDLYVNYQQPNGNGLSGIATSFDGVVNMLNTSIFAKQGQVFLVDVTGKIQIHRDKNLIGSNNVSDLFDLQSNDDLLAQTAAGTINIIQHKSQFLAASFIPSMNWFVVAQVAI